MIKTHFKFYFIFFNNKFNESNMFYTGINDLNFLLKVYYHNMF